MIQKVCCNGENGLNFGSASISKSNRNRPFFYREGDTGSQGASERRLSRPSSARRQQGWAVLHTQGLLPTWGKLKIRGPGGRENGPTKEYRAKEKVRKQ